MKWPKIEPLTEYPLCVDGATSHATIFTKAQVEFGCPCLFNHYSET